MPNSHEQLREHLQRIVANEQSRPTPNTGYPTQIPSERLRANASPGIARFLRKRAAFRDATRNINVGRY